MAREEISRVFEDRSVNSRRWRKVCNNRFNRIALLSRFVLLAIARLRTNRANDALPVKRMLGLRLRRQKGNI